MSELLDVFPRQRFATIVADPPWPSAKRHPAGWTGSMQPKYSTMKAHEILALPVDQIAQPDAVLILWTTWMHLGLAMQVIDRWGFTYCAGFPWVKVVKDAGENLKPIFGLGIWTMGCSELILIGRRGKPFGSMGNPRPARRGIIMTQRGDHSQKPAELMDWVDSHDINPRFPSPKLELFARERRYGWASWGDELENYGGIWRGKASNLVR